jgi:hypothetical protein
LKYLNSEGEKSGFMNGNYSRLFSGFGFGFAQKKNSVSSINHNNNVEILLFNFLFKIWREGVKCQN